MEKFLISVFDEKFNIYKLEMPNDNKIINDFKNYKTKNNIDC